MIAALAVTEIVFSAAHAWSTVLAQGHADARLPRLSDLEHEARHERPVLEAGWPAFTMPVLAAIGAVNPNTAVNAALLINAALSFAGGAALARLAGGRVAMTVVAGAAMFTFGVTLVALKVAVH